MFSLHRVRPLLVAVPRHGHRQAAGAAPAPAQPARLPLRAPGRGDRRSASASPRNGRRRRHRAGRGGREHRRAGDRGRGAVVVQHLPRLRRGLPGHDRVRRQDRRHAPPPGAGGGALPRRADPRLQGDGDAVESRGASAPTKRVDWADGLDIPTIADKPDAEYLYYVGCAGSFDDRNKKTTQAFAKLLKKAGVDFAFLGARGAVQRRLGAPARQRVPLPGHGADGRRDVQRLQA